MENDNIIIDLEEKWKSILDFTSNIVKPIPEDRRLFVAEQMEKKCEEYRNYPRFLKLFIPFVRAKEGYVYDHLDMVYGKVCVTLNGNLHGKDELLSIPLDPEHDITGGYSYFGLYKWNHEEERWQWI